MRRRDWGTSRSPGAAGWAPADKEQKSNPQVLEPIKGTSLIASLNIVPQVSGNAGTTVVCTLLILPVLDLCFMILSLITQFHLFFSIFTVWDRWCLPNELLYTLFVWLRGLTYCTTFTPQSEDEVIHFLWGLSIGYLGAHIQVTFSLFSSCGAEAHSSSVKNHSYNSVLMC